MNLPRAIKLPDRFQLDREIGRGGMAVVYRAHDRHLDRFVAIKVLSADVTSAVGADRFQREISVMAKLVHPGIVALFDSGVSDDRLYYVMPFVAGETLRARLTRERRFTMEDVAALGADVAEALAYAHGFGIVHRDVKPENIFAIGGRAILTDFGIARLIGESTAGGAQLTTSGLVLGTVSYMSPEQAGGELRIDGRSDLYGLGCVLYELLTGSPPFVAPTAMAVIAQHFTAVPRSLHEHDVRVSSALAEIVMQLLAKDPADRPANAGDVARALRTASQASSAVVARETIALSSPSPNEGTVTLGEITSADSECETVAAAIGHALSASLSESLGIRVLTQAIAASSVASTGVTLTGSVRRSGARLRIALRAVSTNGEVTWAEQIDGSFDDIFALEDKVVENVTQKIRAGGKRPQTEVSKPLTRSTPSGTRLLTASISEADHLVAEGRKSFRFGSSGGAAKHHLEVSAIYFKRALELDPKNARALCSFGNWHYVMGVSGLMPRDEAFTRGRELIFSALAADDQCAEVHCSLAKVALYFDDDFHATARHIERSLELDPNDTEALRIQSIVYKILGRIDEAVRVAQSATVRAPEVAVLWNCLGDALLSAGRNAEAVDALRQAIATTPNFGPAQERLEIARVRLGEMDLAIEMRASRLGVAGQRERASLLTTESTELGATEALRRDVRRELDGHLKQSESIDAFAEYFTTRTLADRIVMGFAMLGEYQSAMDWVERSYENRPGRLRRMLTDLPFDRQGFAL
ncbi:MAG: protein kinase, partial [Gemmatimonadaceae bacterium]